MLRAITEFLNTEQELLEDQASDLRKQIRTKEEKIKHIKNLLSEIIPDSCLPGHEALKLLIGNIDLSQDIANSLNRQNINTVSELIKKTPVELLGFQGIGEGSLFAIKISLRRYGVSLRSSTN